MFVFSKNENLYATNNTRKIATDDQVQRRSCQNTR